jgi:hypothetical protein
MPRQTQQPDHPKRLSLSEILTLMLQRGGSDRSSVSLARNAKGQTQIDVTIRTGNQDDAATAEQAMAKAVTLYDALRYRYPIEGDDVPAMPEPLSETETELLEMAERWAAGVPEPSDDPKRLGNALAALIADRRGAADA